MQDTATCRIFVTKKRDVRGGKSETVDQYTRDPSRIVAGLLKWRCGCVAIDAYHDRPTLTVLGQVRRIHVFLILASRPSMVPELSDVRSVCHGPHGDSRTQRVRSAEGEPRWGRFRGQSVSPPCTVLIHRGRS